MTGTRSFLSSIGLALAGAGLLFVFAPGLAGVLSVPRALVLVLGLFAFVQAMRSIQARRRSELELAEPADTEPRHETDRPGDDFDDRLAVLPRSRGVSWAGGEHERIRRRLREGAVEAASHRWRLSTDDARERIDTGDWTDDRAAAWFIGDSRVDPPPWAVRIRAYLEARTSFGFYANRTADAIVELREEP